VPHCCHCLEPVVRSKWLGTGPSETPPLVRWQTLGQPSTRLADEPAQIPSPSLTASQIVEILVTQPVAIDGLGDLELRGIGKSVQILFDCSKHCIRQIAIEKDPDEMLAQHAEISTFYGD
jgi:hypothetical protein